jgi:cyclopropane fatty-acyl-phospholipid synthase-like methyltransferase
MTSISNINSNTHIDSSTKWFASWFDTPYYHTLYKERDFSEAKVFMDNLTHYLNLPEKATILDLACGKGRHAIYLNELGYQVTGVDLSENNITEASKNATESLHFKVHDMREKTGEKFDAIFNLFTSFGYFDDEKDNFKTLKTIQESLTEYGFAVIDFMNVNFVINHLIANEIKTVDGIDFHISRYTKDGFIIKEIDFTHEEKSHHFVEKISAFTLEDFEKMMEDAGIFLLDTFGDYKLNKYHKSSSERLIMIFK